MTVGDESDRDDRDWEWWHRKQYGTCLLMMVGLVVGLILVFVVGGFLAN